MRLAGGIAGAVAPTAAAQVTLRPVDTSATRIHGGLLGERQQVNHDVTIPHGVRELERAGTLDNFRIAAGRIEGTRRGMVFSDSDVYKWLEAVAWELGRRPSAELEQLANETIELVAAAQQPDGYLNTWCQIIDADWRWTDLEMGHELYCAGHLIQAGIAFARTTGDSTLLAVARRFADLIDDVFSAKAEMGTEGHPEIEPALVELYRHTGERRYLDLAGKLVDRRGYGQFAGGRFELDYYQDARPVRESHTIVGHAVRALYLCSGVTDLYAETGDETLLQAMLAQWDDLALRKTYLTGGAGSRHSGEAFGDAYELPPDRAYCETCAAIASIMWNWRLLLVTGDARFADLLERTLYNGFLAGLSLDGASFFYTNPLHSRGGHSRAGWNPVACCPPNIMRLLSSLDQYLASQTETGIQVHQYAPSTISGTGPGGAPIELRVETGYPWAGTVGIEVVASPAEDWTLALRIPAWARDSTIDGSPVAAGNYAELTRSWQPGDRVSLELDVSPRLTAPNPRIDAVRGCLAVERGPLVYCLESEDLPSTVELSDLAIDAERPLEDGDPIEALAGAATISVGGNVHERDGWRSVEYLDLRDLSPGTVQEPASFRAVPYFAWGNRGSGAMRVWIPVSGD